MKKQQLAYSQLKRLCLLTLIVGSSLLSYAQNCVTDFDAYKSGLNVVFDNKSSNNGGFAYYVWTFGDGSPAYYQLPHDNTATHKYANPGTYQVCVTDSFCIDSTKTKCKNVTVTSVPAISADFTHTQIGDGLYQFSGIPSQTSKALFIHWDFGDGNSSELPVDTQKYKVSGSYNVCFSLVDSNFNFDYQCKQIDVTVVNYCTAKFSYHVVNNQIVFTNNSFTSDTIPSYRWRFGDGNFSIAQSPTYQYTAPGTYSVTLSLTGNCKDSFTMDVTQPDTVDCNARFSTTITNQRVLFTVTEKTSNPFGYYSFDFGDGNHGSTNGEAIENIYNGIGSYYVCLTNYNPLCGGIPVMHCDSVRITSVVPICKADFNIYPNGLEVFLNNTSMVYGTQLPYQIAIDWGNGKKMLPSNDSFFYSNIYDSAGIFPVTLTLISSAGCRDSITKVVGVGPKYKLSGQIMAGGSWASFAGINIYAFEPSTGMLTHYAYTSATDSGRYEIELPQGYYLVQADFLFSQTNGFYLPTYYKNKLNWDVADVITLTSNRSGIDIDLIEFVTPNSGGGNIKGNVVFGAGNSNQNGPVLPGTPADKMLLYLLSEEGNPVLYTHTRVDGTFEFNQLPMGKYKVWAEMAGKVTTPALVTLGANNTDASGIVIVVGKNTITTSIVERVQESTFEASVYPNPVNDVLYIDTDKNDIANVTLYSITGQEVKQVNIEESNNGLRLDMSALNTGLYVLKMQTKDGKTAIHKVQKRD